MMKRCGGFPWGRNKGTFKLFVGTVGKQNITSSSFPPLFSLAFVPLFHNFAWKHIRLRNTEVFSVELKASEWISETTTQEVNLTFDSCWCFYRRELLFCSSIEILFSWMKNKEQTRHRAWAELLSLSGTYIYIYHVLYSMKYPLFSYGLVSLW